MKRLLLALTALCTVAAYLLVQAPAQAAINPMISFQGKLTNPDGTNVADNTYSIRFRIYTDPSADTGSCANTCKWEETQGSVSVSGGLFHVNLGSGTALPGSVDFNGNALYLGIKVGSDAEMTPRVRLTAAPYAFNSDTLDGIDSSALVQLSPGSQQSGDINISGTVTSGAVNGISIGSTIQPSAAGALTVRSNGANALNLTGGAASTWDVGNNLLSLQTTNNGPITTGTGLWTQGGNLTFSGTAARTITGPGTGGLTVNVTSGPLAFSTTTSGTLSVSSAGALNLSGGAASSLNVGANTLAVTSSNFSVSTAGAITAATSTNTINNLVINNGSLSNVGANVTGSGALTVASGGAGALTLDSASNTLLLAASDTMVQRTASGTTTINLVDGANTLLSVTNSGAGNAVINADGGYQVNGTPGASTTCSGGQFLQNQVVNGGLSTGGSCATTYATVQDEGSNLTARPTLNFTGGGIACTDNAGSSRTDCSVGFISSDGAGATSSASGLESGTGGFGLIQGCADGQVLKWDDTASTWQCGTDRGSHHNVMDGDYTNTTTTFTDVDNNSDSTDSISFPIGANETWIFMMNVQLLSNATADQKWRVNAPAGATCDISVANVEQTVSVSNLACGATSGNLAADTATNNILITGSVRNGGTGGTVILQYGQVAVSGTATVFAGSYINAYRVDGADLAEVYYTKDTGVVPGTLVSLDPRVEAGVARTREPYDPNLLGIVSTKPGHVLGETKPPPGGAPVMIALSGRVPVRVSAENGAIRPGDYLTSSPTPGVAMRASEPGFAVAQALTGYDGQGEGSVVGFIKPVWYSPPQVKGADLQNSLLNDRAITGLHGNGPLVVTNDALFQGKVAVNDIHISGHLTVGGDTAGTVIIPAGNTSAEVTFGRKYKTPPKITTGVSDYTPVKVDRKTVDGFRLNIPSPRAEDLFIDWFAAETE